MTIILLDAGHGGKDSGAVGHGLKEKDITLDICKRIEKGLSAYQNTTTIMIRTSDIYLTLEERTRKANSTNGDVILSVHTNGAGATSARGFESFTHPLTGSPTVAFQNVMHGEIMKVLGTGIIDRGKKQQNFHMVRETKMKAVLTENLFITNAADAALLAQPDFRQKIAQGHINGLEKFLGLKKAAQPPPHLEKPKNKLWLVQVGAFEHRENAEKLVQQLYRDGYKPIIKQQ